jgi:hypothetical protein
VLMLSDTITLTYIWQRSCPVTQLPQCFSIVIVFHCCTYMNFKRYILYHSSYEWQIWQTWQIGVRNNFITLCMSMIFCAINLFKKNKIQLKKLWRSKQWTVGATTGIVKFQNRIQFGPPFSLSKKSTKFSY